jgi:hypothetical protein
MNCASAKIILLMLSSVLASAQVTFTTTTSDDAFLATGSPSNPNGTNLTDLNYGVAGILCVAPVTAIKGEFQSVLKFNLSGATNLFNATYGPNWLIGAVSLELTSSFGTQGVQPDNGMFNAVNGGNFAIEWLAADNWAEGTGRPNNPTTDGVTYNSLPTLLAGAHEILCTNNYIPPGDNVHVTWPLPLKTNLVNDIAAGGAVSFRFFAADEQVGYLFNSHNFGNGNQPLLHVTAIPLLKILSACLTNGMFHLVAIGGINATYQVQANTNLSTTNWQTLGTVTADASGAIQFDDFTATNQPQRFYRIAE